MKIIKLVFGNLFILFILFLACEMGLRVLGKTPYQKHADKPDIVVTPGGKFFTQDSLLGYSHLPGNYKVTLQGKHEFNVHNDENGNRLTSFDSLNNTPAIWIFGCSFTYGWGVDTEASFPFLLQTQFKDQQITNWGKCGHGSIHFYLQLKAALKKKLLPELIIINHADFHHERNTFSHKRRREVTRWNFLGNQNQPYAELNKNGKLELKHSNIEYQPSYLSKYSAFINWCEIKFETYLDKKNDQNEINITRLIYDQINKLCKENNIKLLLTNIGDDPAFIKNYCQENKIPFLDISIDLSKSGNTNEPYDNHPSPRVHHFYAEKLFQHLNLPGQQ